MFRWLRCILWIFEILLIKSLYFILFFQIGSVLLAVITFKRKKDRNFLVSFAQFSNLISLSSFKFSFVSLKFKLQKFRAASSSSIRTGLHGRNNFELVSEGEKKKKKRKRRARGQFFFNWISRIRREMSENKMRKWIANAFKKVIFWTVWNNPLPPLSYSNRFRINNLKPCGFVPRALVFFSSNRIVYESLPTTNPLDRPFFSIIEKFTYRNDDQRERCRRKIEWYKT